MTTTFVKILGSFFAEDTRGRILSDGTLSILLLAHPRHLSMSILLWRRHFCPSSTTEVEEQSLLFYFRTQIGAVFHTTRLTPPSLKASIPSPLELNSHRENAKKTLAITPSTRTALSTPETFSIYGVAVRFGHKYSVRRCRRSLSLARSAANTQLRSPASVA